MRQAGETAFFKPIVFSTTSKADAVYSPYFFLVPDFYLFVMNRRVETKLSSPTLSEPVVSTSVASSIMNPGCSGYRSSWFSAEPFPKALWSIFVLTVDSAIVFCGTEAVSTISYCQTFSPKQRNIPIQVVYFLLQ